MTTYIIKSSLSLLLLFGLYWFLLRKEKLFVFNRFFLVASVVFSLLVPFISIPVNFPTIHNLENYISAFNHITPEIITADKVVQNAANISQPYIQNETPLINFSVVLFLLYFSGVLLFLIRFLRNLILIAQMSRLSEKIIFNGYQIILTNDQTGPCCFFDHIFLNRDDYHNGKIDKDLLNHEMEHVRQSHTIDIILIELVKVFYWFNPVYLLYERAIRINHEYLADNKVISDNSDIKTYADKLLNFLTCSTNWSLTSGSNNSFTKMRLIMMMKSSSGRFTYGARIAITLCMVIFFTLLLSFKQANTKQITSMTVYKGVLDTLLVDENPLKTNKSIMNLTPQSSNVIDKKVTYTASGYIKQDTINQMIVLIDNAIVTFGEIRIKADSIVFNRETNQIYAMGRQGSSGIIIGKPIFKVGSQEFEADEITYNLNTRKALVKNMLKQENRELKDSGSIVKPSTPKQNDRSNNDTSDTIEKSVILQDNNSDRWWLQIVKKHGINYKSYTIHNEFVIFGDKTIKNDLESFSNVIAISNDNDTYSIYRSKTASYDIKSHWLKIYDCTLERFFWNPSYTETENPAYHKNISVNFTKGWIVIADASSN